MWYLDSSGVRCARPIANHPPQPSELARDVVGPLTRVLCRSERSAHVGGEGVDGFELPFLQCKAGRERGADLGGGRRPRLQCFGDRERQFGSQSALRTGIVLECLLLKLLRGVS